MFHQRAANSARLPRYSPRLQPWVRDQEKAIETVSTVSCLVLPTKVVGISLMVSSTEATWLGDILRNSPRLQLWVRAQENAIETVSTVSCLVLPTKVAGNSSCSTASSLPCCEGIRCERSFDLSSRNLPDARCNLQVKGKPRRSKAIPEVVTLENSSCNLQVTGRATETQGNPHGFSRG